MENSDILKQKGLKVTPQRLAVLEAIQKLNNHPSAENIIDNIKVTYPNISVATVYKVLETFVDQDILKKIKTENEINRYEFSIARHHHLFCDKTHEIKDFHNQELDHLIQSYFEKNQISNFEIKDFQLNINGIFKSN